MASKYEFYWRAGELSNWDIELKFSGSLWNQSTYPRFLVMGENIKNGRRYLIFGQYSPPLRETAGVRLWRGLHANLNSGPDFHRRFFHSRTFGFLGPISRPTLEPKIFSLQIRTQRPKISGKWWIEIYFSWKLVQVLNLVQLGQFVSHSLVQKKFLDQKYFLDYKLT